MGWIIRIALIVLGPETAVILLHKYSAEWRRLHVTALVVLVAVLIDIPFYFGVYSAYAISQASGAAETAPALVLGGWYNKGFFTDETPYGALIAETALKHGIDPVLFTAQIKQESAFNPGAVSKAGAVGLGQLMPIIINWCGISDPYDPQQNLDCSARFMRSLLDKYPTTMLALAAYNAGEPAVDRCNCVPDNGETVGYVQAISRYHKAYLSGLLDLGTVVDLLYADSSPTQTQGYHGIVPGYSGWDFAGGCGTPLFSPIPGEAKITYNGMDGYNHTDGAGRTWPQATMIVIEGAAGKVTLLHGLYNRVEVGDVVIGGKTRIGSEAQFGYATGCHQHIVLEK